MSILMIGDDTPLKRDVIPPPDLPPGHGPAFVPVRKLYAIGDFFGGGLFTKRDGTESAGLCSTRAYTNRMCGTQCAVLLCRRCTLRLTTVNKVST